MHEQAVEVYRRVADREISAWNIRVRGKTPTDALQVIDTLSPPEGEDPNLLLDAWEGIIQTHTEGGLYTHLSIEAIATGSKSPFHSLTRRLTVRSAYDEEPEKFSEAGAMWSLARQGMKANELLFSLCDKLQSMAFNAIASERAAVLSLTELMAQAEAGDTQRGYEMAAEALNSAMPHMASAFEAANNWAIAQRLAAEAELEKARQSG